eukprot:3013233-Prymnesium_polylepis.1
MIHSQPSASWNGRCGPRHTRYCADRAHATTHIHTAWRTERSPHLDTRVGSLGILKLRRLETDG